MRKVSICFLCLFGTGLFSQGIPYGQEFQVNTYTHAQQVLPVITALKGGGFVVCWTSSLQNGFSNSVFGQAFEGSAAKKGYEFQVTTDLQFDQSPVSASGLPDGGFVVCWMGFRELFLDGIYAQLFDAEMTKKGNKIPLDANVQCYGHESSIAGLRGGDLVACWSGCGDKTDMNVFAQLIHGPDEIKYPPIQVNTYPKNGLSGMAVSALTNGGFVVCWASGSGLDVYGQLFDSSGARRNGEFRVNSYIRSDQQHPVIAPMSGGGFVVCWESLIQDGSGLGVFGQVFNESGGRIGNEFRANTRTEDYQYQPAVAALSGGGFVVCWTSYWQDGTPSGIYARLFDSSGQKLFSEFRVNTYRGMQSQSGVAGLSEGGFVACWASEGQDGFGSGILAKRFPGFPAAVTLHPFALIEPGLDTTIDSVRCTLKWHRRADPQICYPWELQFRVYIDENPDFTSPEIREAEEDTTITLENLKPGTTYFWKVLARNIASDSLWSSNTNAFFVSHTAGVVDEEKSKLPDQFILHANFPNPFNPETSIRFDMPESGFVVVSVYDVNGRLVRMLMSKSRTAGSHSVKWDGKDSFGNLVPSSIYVCRLEVRSADGRRFSQSVKMGLVR